MIVKNADDNAPKADICVVGAGPVGLALASSLEKRGKSVLLLDAGGDVGPLPLMSAAVLNEHHAPLNVSNASGLGGSSALWGGRCVALDDVDFAVRPHVPHSGWPIPHSDVSRHYAEAFAFLNVRRGEVPPHPDTRIDDDVHVDALEWWSDQPALGKTHRDKINASKLIRYLPGTSVMAIEMDQAGGSVTHVVVLEGGKVSKIPVGTLVLACGGIGNTRLLFALQSRLVDNSLSPALGRFYQGHLTGYIAAVEFSQERTARALMFQETGGTSVFRRRFQLSASAQRKLETLNTAFWLDSISISDPLHRSAGLSALFLSLQFTGLYQRLSRGQAAGSKPRARREYGAHLRNLRPSLPMLRDCLRTLAALMRQRGGSKNWQLANPARRYLLRYHAEQVPDCSSAVLPIGTPAQDAATTVGIDYRVCDQDLTSVLKSHECLDRWLRRNGLGRLDYLHPEATRLQALKDQAYDGFHQIGLARMSDDRETGVVDRDCKVHGVSNLYLAGSCVFPTGGQANPTLPAVALAMRLADHLSDEATSGPSRAREQSDTLVPR